MPLDDGVPERNGTPGSPAEGRRRLALNGFGKVGETVLPSGPGAPRAARSAVTEWLAPAVAPSMLDDVRLVVTELVTNSVRHAQLRAGAAITVRLRLAQDGLRLEVENPGTAGRITVNGDRRPDGGLGLQLVERLGTSWGIVRDRDTTVWVEMAQYHQTR